MTPFPNVRSIALALAVAALPAIASAAPIGVTAAADGDPLGKPPAAKEHVLRVGVDVQASEVVITGGNDRAQLLFIDGTALTIGPNAELRIDRFVFDPSSASGELGVTLGKGVLRMVGGKISKTKPVTVNTPGGMTGIRGGIAIINAQPGQTNSTFMFGRDMTVSGQGVTQTVTRPGYEIVQRFGAPPQAPRPVSEQTLNAQVQQLEGRSNGAGNAPQGGAATIKVSQGLQNVAAQQPAPGPAANAGSSQPTGWQLWGGGVAYQNPSAVNPAIVGGTNPELYQNPSVVNPAIVGGTNPQLPNTGTAAYNGSFTVSATSFGNPTTINGSFNMSWNFASRNGSFSLVSTTPSNPGTGIGTISANGSGFSGAFTVTGGGTGGYGGSGTVQGNFVSTPSSSVGAVRGTINGQGGGGNSVSGTFSASR